MPKSIKIRIPGGSKQYLTLSTPRDKPEEISHDGSPYGSFPKFVDWIVDQLTSNLIQLNTSFLALTGLYHAFADDDLLQESLGYVYFMGQFQSAWEGLNDLLGNQLKWPLPNGTTKANRKPKVYRVRRTQLTGGYSVDAAFYGLGPKHPWGPPEVVTRFVVQVGMKMYGPTKPGRYGSSSSSCIYPPACPIPRARPRKPRPDPDPRTGG